MKTTSPHKTHHTLFTIAVGVIIVFSFVPTILSGFASHYVKQAQAYMTEEYNPSAALASYNTALRFDADNKIALYDTARLYGIVGDYDKSLAAADAYKKAYPEEKRIHYVAGLTHAFKGDLSAAEREFQAFISSGISEWQGYLDLAWVQFQQGNYDGATALLEQAKKRFGGNAWLNTSLGAAYIAQGNLAEAQDVLIQAQSQMDVTSFSEWAYNYSFNNPANFAAEMMQMQQVIAANLAVARGESDVVAVAEALGSPFIGVSPEGYTKGIAVSACGSTCSSVPCTSEANACGQVAAGSRFSCSGTSSFLEGFMEGGSCSADTPPLPNGYGNSCSTSNACGQTVSGTIGCDGLCSAQAGPCSQIFVPSISSGQCIAGQARTFNVVATDPQGDPVRYGLDWDNNGTIDQYTPSSGYAPSGVTQDISHIFTEGNHTIAVRVEDDNGVTSSFVTHTVVCNAQTEVEAEDTSGESSFGGNSGEFGDGNGDGSGQAVGELFARPELVRVGGTSLLTWTTEGVDSCVVTGTNGDQFTGVNGSRTSGAITERTVFTLSCDNGALVDTAVVNVLPAFQEI